MDFDITYKKLHHLLDFRADHELIHEIVLKSSFIEFVSVGETLFNKGDWPFGFYWILDGRAKMEVANGSHISFKKGDMSGLDSFLTQENHKFKIISASSKLETLFIDKNGFEGFRSNDDLKKIINSQVVSQLKQYRNLLSNCRNITVK